jgi:hypothetical protein
MRTPHSQRSYDYRIRQTICESGDRDLFPELDIPRSTVRSWIHRGVPDVVTSDLVARDRSDLLIEIEELQRRVALLGAVIGGAVAIDLASARQAAREERMKTKRAARCGVWIGKGDHGRCSCNGHAPGCHETQLG